MNSPINTLKVKGLPLQQINDSLEVIFSTHWDLQSSGVHLELCAESLNNLPGVRTSTISI
jgi:N6-adenosine-specific RNA methylase IME4